MHTCIHHACLFVICVIIVRSLLYFITQGKRTEKSVHKNQMKFKILYKYIHIYKSLLFIKCVCINFISMCLFWKYLYMCVFESIVYLSLDNIRKRKYNHNNNNNNLKAISRPLISFYKQIFTKIHTLSFICVCIYPFIFWFSYKPTTLINTHTLWCTAYTNSHCICKYIEKCFVYVRIAFCCFDFREKR